MEFISAQKVAPVSRWQPPPHRAPSMRGRPRMGVTVMEATGTTLVTVGAVGATFGGFYLLTASNSAGYKVAGALAAAFGMAGLLNQLGRL